MSPAMSPKTGETLAESFADEFEAFVTSDDEYGDQEFGQFCQKHHAEILARLRSQSAQADWKEDPAADERWNAGLDFGLVQLCTFLGVDPKSIRWDAATETLDGDVQDSICKIFTAHFGEDFDFRTPAPATQTRQEIAEAETKLLEEAWGALNFILAFYQPGQRHLDTNAWRQAVASGRRIHAKLRETIDARRAIAKLEERG